MTNHQKTLVQTSFRQVLPIADQAATLFYNRLFEVAPDVRSLFKGDMAEQGRKLFQVIGFAVDSLDNPGVLLPAVKNLGDRHRHYGVQPSHYTVVGETLLWTLNKGLGEAFTPEVETAWTAVYGVLASTMRTVD